MTVAVEEKLKNAVRSQAVLQGKTFKQALDEALRDWLRGRGRLREKGRA